MYILFMWSRYYPRGGYNDFYSTFGSLDAARQYAHKNDEGCEKYQIVDTRGFTVVESGSIEDL